ncbi:MAG: flavodoxin family protein [Marinilabiliales bacterium]|nr:MAG: flavodoxin family protein [Marinilabiliales bacterium]
MKVVAFNGSPRKNGNTSIMIQKVFDVLEAKGADCEMVQLGGEKLSGCRACASCKKNKDKQCIVKDDIINSCIQKMIDADVILIGSPTYFSNLTTEVKALIDRAGYVTRANGNLLKHKIGASLVAVRRAGAIHTFNSINHFFLLGEMVVPGSSYWNLALGREIGEVEDDEEGMKTMKDLAENILWLHEKISQ